MSRPVLNHRAAGRAPRLLLRAAAATVLGSILYAGVSVSTASASQPPPASDGTVVDADGNTALPAPSTGSGTEYIVQLEPSADIHDVVADVAADGVKVTGTMQGAIDAFTAPLDAAAVTELRARDDVVRVVRQHSSALDEVQYDAPWGLDRIDQPALPYTNTYTYPNSGAGVDVYVIDTGIRETQTEFTGRIKPGAYLDFGDGNGIKDCIGHGTHVAGIAGGTTWGVAKAVSIVPVSVFKCGARSTPNPNIIAGINWVVEDHQAGQPAVVNMSLNSPVDPVLEDAVKAMVADGMTVAVSAGNDAATSSCDQSPARVPEVITVAASEVHDVRASFSSPGSCNDLFAPGVVIRSADATSDSGSALSSGTSMAAPHVAGAAALILERHPTFKPSQVWATMDYVATPGVITGQGPGDPDKLLRVATEPDPPAAPTGLTAEVAPATGVGSGEVTLTWTAPATTTPPITDYVIERSPNGTTGWTVVDDGVSTATTATVGGLENGTTYWFRVAAENYVMGTATAPVMATPVWVPDAIELTAAVWPTPGVGAGQVRLVWSGLSNGSPITDYLIQVSLDGATWTTLSDGVSAVSSFTWLGVTGGTAFSFRVAAKNALGTGPWSATVTATPASEPGVPTALTAAVAPATGVGSGEVQLSWTPAPANGSAISDYLIQSSLDGATWTNVDDAVATSPSALVRGLIHGTEYQFRVAAVNGVGTGPWSVTVSATPLGSPDAPGGLTVTVAPATGVSSGEVRLDWIAPADTDGLPIVDYVIERSVDGTSWTTVPDELSTMTTHTVGGLTDGTAYTFRVAAVNAAGHGAWSTPIEGTPRWIAAAVDRLATAVAPATAVGSGQVKLTWSLPTSTGGATITDYVIQRSTNGTTWTTIRDGLSPARSSLLRGLTNGTRYRFRVAAVNAVGKGPWSPIVGATPRWKPGAPGGLRATVAPTAGVGSRQVKLTWNAPGSSGGAKVTDYLIQSSANGIAWTTVRDGVSTTRSALVRGLTNGTQYRFRVAARNVVGQGSWSAVVRATPRAR
jgi:subtilisin family serine protease